MNIKICLWNWIDYNNGVDNWKWFTLPDDTEIIWKWIEALHNDGKGAIFICDSEHAFISESTSIVELIELSNSDYNDIIELSSYEPVYEIEMLDYMLEAYTPSEIANMLHFGNYSPLDNYFMFNGYGNIVTLSEYDYEKYMDNAFNEGALEFMSNVWEGF